MTAFTEPSDALIDEIVEYVTENTEVLVRSLFDGSLFTQLSTVVSDASERVAAGEAATPSQPEPQVHSVVSFTAKSPSDGITRSYSATRTSKGWSNTSGTSRLSKDASWAEIVKFADGPVEVLRDGPVKV